MFCDDIYLIVMKAVRMTKRKVDKQKLIEKIAQEAVVIEDRVMHSYLLKEKDGFTFKFRHK